MILLALLFSYRSVLYIASLTGYPQIVSLLLDNGADPNQKDIHGWTPLHRAALWGYVDIAKMLIENGANINASEEIPFIFILFNSLYLNLCFLILIGLLYTSPLSGTDKQ